MTVKLHVAHLEQRLTHSNYSLNVSCCGWCYNWPLNNMGLNRTGPLIRRFFSIVTSTVLHHLGLAESEEAELRI